MEHGIFLTEPQSVAVPKYNNASKCSPKYKRHVCANRKSSPLVDAPAGKGLQSALASRGGKGDSVLRPASQLLPGLAVVLVLVLGRLLRRGFGGAFDVHVCHETVSP